MFQITWYAMDDNDDYISSWDASTMHVAHTAVLAQMDAYPGSSGASIRTPNGEYIYYDNPIN